MHSFTGALLFIQSVYNKSCVVKNLQWPYTSTRLFLFAKEKPQQHYRRTERGQAKFSIKLFDTYLQAHTETFFIFQYRLKKVLIKTLRSRTKRKLIMLAWMGPCFAPPFCLHGDVIDTSPASVNN